MFSIISSIVGTALDAYKTAKKAKQDDNAAMLAAQAASYNAAAKHEEALMTIAKGQSDQNIALAQTGRLGWRDWLGKGLTIALLFLLAHILLGVGLMIWFSVFHIDPKPIVTALALIPSNLLDWLKEFLVFLLGGLYIARGVEKNQLIKVNSFNEKTFYDTYRKLNGDNISPDEFDRLNQAIRVATKS